MESYLDVQHLTKSFGEKVLFDDMSFSVSEGQKVGLVARNGTGKSTLLSILHGDEGYDAGQIVYRNDIRVGYLEQTPHFNPTDTVLDACFNHEGNPEKVLRAKQVLTQLRIEDLEQKVGELSGGQLKRVALANVLLLEPDFLILDEPTNHMDMRSKDILKNAIMKYDGTVIVVSHDREFLDGMVSKVYEFRNGGVREYLGGIYYFLEKRKLESLQEVERKDAPAKEAAPKASSSGKLTYEQKKEQEKLLRKLRKAVETIEASLADLEKKIADYDRKFAEATQYNEADYKAYNELKAEYDHQMHEWEKASYELEITEGE